jgi:hypothetical protein
MRSRREGEQTKGGEAERRRCRGLSRSKARAAGLAAGVVFIALGGALGAVPSQPWRRGALDALPSRKKAMGGILEEEWASAEAREKRFKWAAGLLRFFSPHLFFSCRINFRENKRRL